MKVKMDASIDSLLGPVVCVVGARPNFMKMAPILRAFAAHERARKGPAG